MTRRPMKDLPRGARFRWLDGRERLVLVPASEHENGWVEVRDLSMTDQEAERLLSGSRAVEKGCDPRDGVFTRGQVDTDVEVLS